MRQHSNYRGPRRKREKVYEKIFEDIAIEDFPNMGKEIVNQVQEVQSPIYDKRKKYDKIQSNQTNKYLAQRKNIESSKRKTTSNIQGKALCLTADLSAETLQARREWQDIFKILKDKKPMTKIILPGRHLIQN